MMDMQWIIEQNMSALANGACPKQVSNAILVAVSQAENDTMQDYAKAKIALSKALEQFPKEQAIICKMMDKIIADEADHSASALKAAQACIGEKEPKAVEYNEAVKENDRQTD